MVATEEKLIKVAAKHGGNCTKTAKEIGITHQAVSKRLNENPHLKEKIQSIKDAALKKSGLSLVKAFKRTAEALDAKQYSFGKKTQSPDHDIRLKASKLTAEFYDVLNKPDQQLSSGQIVVMPVVVVNGNPLSFKVGKNA